LGPVILPSVLTCDESAAKGKRRPTVAVERFANEKAAGPARGFFGC